MMAKLLFLLTILVILPPPLVHAQQTQRVAPQVNVNVNDRVYSFEQPIRLSVLLSVVANQGDWHWPASAVYKLGIPQELGSEAEIKAKLVDFSKRLSARNPSSTRTIQRIINDIMQWQIADRLDIALDYDRTRLLKHKNPLLTPGNYLFRLREHPKTITTIGTLQNTGTLTYRPNMKAADVVDDAGQTNITNPDFVYVIAPNGEIEKRGIAYWNIDLTPIAPGSLVVALVRESILGDDERQFNEFLVELARNRVLP